MVTLKIAVCKTERHEETACSAAVNCMWKKTARNFLFLFAGVLS
jgi:hypothetical protein